MILQTKFPVITPRESETEREREIQCRHPQRIFVMIELQQNVNAWLNSHKNVESLLRCHVVIIIMIIMVIVTASQQNNFHTLLFQTGHSLSQKLTAGNAHNITACFKSSQQYFPQFQSPENMEVLITNFIFKANVTSQRSSKVDLRYKFLKWNNTRCNASNLI